MRFKYACQGGLTNDVLDDNLHSPERHVATRDAVGSTGAPFIRGHSLQEMLNGRKQLHWVKFQIRQILRNVPGQFPYALQNEFCYLGFLGVREGAVRWEWSDDLKEKSGQGTIYITIKKFQTLRIYSDITHRKTVILRPVENIRSMIMLMNLDKFLTSLS